MSKSFAQDGFCCGGFGPYPISADAEASADFGALGVYAQIVNGYIADAGASWTDQFTITGAAPGTVLDFSFTMRVDGNLTKSQEFTQDAKVQSWVTGFPSPSICMAPESNELCNAGYVETLSAFGRTIYGDRSQTVSVQLIAGQTYEITQSLTGYAVLNGFFFDPDVLLAGATITADFLNTAGFTLTPISPGANYTTASGNRYDASAVPEPTALLLLATGYLIKRFRR